MSLSGGTAGGKGVDSNAVDPYDSGDEWDIGVGNLIIDLEADLEKDKLEMSGSKEAGGMAAPPSAVAALPDNIKFVSPVGAPQGKESKSKSKRNKNSKDNSTKSPAGDTVKKEHQGRTQVEVSGTTVSSGGGGNATPGKGMEKSGKAPRCVPNNKKDKEVSSGKNKKEKSEGAVAVVAIEKEVAVNAQALGNTARSTSFDGTQNMDMAVTEPHGNNTLESVGIVPLSIKSEPEDMDNVECRALKKVKSEKIIREVIDVHSGELAKLWQDEREEEPKTSQHSHRRLPDDGRSASVESRESHVSSREESSNRHKHHEKNIREHSQERRSKKRRRDSHSPEERHHKKKKKKSKS